MSTSTELEEKANAHDRLSLYAVRASTYFFAAALAVFVVWFVLLMSILFDMRANPSQFFGPMHDPGFVDYVRTVLTYGTTYPIVVTMLAVAGVAARLYAHGQAAKLERHDELLDVLEGRMSLSNAGNEDDDD